jgi:hypothetical protein
LRKNEKVIRRMMKLKEEGKRYEITGMEYFWFLKG